MDCWTISQSLVILHFLSANYRLTLIKIFPNQRDICFQMLTRPGVVRAMCGGDDYLCLFAPLVFVSGWLPRSVQQRWPRTAEQSKWRSETSRRERSFHRPHRPAVVRSSAQQ